MANKFIFGGALIGGGVVNKMTAQLISTLDFSLLGSSTKRLAGCGSLYHHSCVCVCRGYDR